MKTKEEIKSRIKEYKEFLDIKQGRHNHYKRKIARDKISELEWVME